MISVLIADDQELVRAGFRAILESAGDIAVIGEASNGRRAVELSQRLRPDVVLLDIRMPVMDGIEATERLLGASSPPQILILTTFGLDEYVYASLKAGATGFMLKDSPRDQLVAAVRTVADGETILSPSLTRRLIERFVTRSTQSTNVARRLEHLTRRELEVLRWMAQGMSNAEIADELYVSPATIKTHVASILSKLGIQNRVQAVVMAYESGLVGPDSA